MARLLFAFLLLATAVIQATLMPRLNPLVAAPDLVLILLFFRATLCSTKETLAWVFATGLLLDVLAVDTFGVNGLALLPLVLLAGLTRERKLHSNIIVPVVLVVIASLFHVILLGMLRGDVIISFAIGLHLGLQVFMTAALYLILRVIDR